MRNPLVTSTVNPSAVTVPTEPTARCPGCGRQAKIISISAKTPSKALACVCGKYVVVKNMKDLRALTGENDD